MPIRRLKLKKLFNTRDLGGMQTEDGKHIVYKKLIRSGKLYKLPDETIRALRDSGVNRVIDLRIYTECEEYPDTIIEGVDYIHLPVLCTATAGITREKSMRRTMAVESRRIKAEFGSADNYMIEMYKTILFSEEPQNYLKQTLKLIIENEGCILWHCSGGKDRAGIVAMLVESLLGVDEDTIIEDYVASYYFQRRKFFWNKFGLRVVPIYPRFRKILYGMMAAKPVYMTSTLDAIKEKYGSVVNYCRQALNITDDDIKTLKDKYLE